jgi:hypothetical protein
MAWPVLPNPPRDVPLMALFGVPAPTPRPASATEPDGVADAGEDPPKIERVQWL